MGQRFRDPPVSPWYSSGWYHSDTRQARNPRSPVRQQLSPHPGSEGRRRPCWPGPAPTARPCVLGAQPQPEGAPALPSVHRRAGAGLRQCGGSCGGLTVPHAAREACRLSSGPHASGSSPGAGPRRAPRPTWLGIRSSLQSRGVELELPAQQRLRLKLSPRPLGTQPGQSAEWCSAPQVRAGSLGAPRCPRPMMRTGALGRSLGPRPVLILLQPRGPGHS